MTRLRTNWSYEVEADGDKLPPLISLADFKALQPNLSSSDAKILAVLDGVSQAVRDWCGWHVAPLLTCYASLTPRGQLVELPCMGIVSIASVEVCSESVDDYEWMEPGLIRLPRKAHGWRSVAVEFTAGYGQVSALAAAVAQIAENRLVAAAGVSEEHAGDAGITYNRTDSGVSGGVRLLSSDYALLAAYRMPGRC